MHDPGTDPQRERSGRGVVVEGCLASRERRSGPERVGHHVPRPGTSCREEEIEGTLWEGGTPPSAEAGDRSAEGGQGSHYRGRRQAPYES